MQNTIKLQEVLLVDDTKLRALMASVRCGSFSKAAEQLDYSQSGLTHMMDKLEAELGCTLLERGYQGVRLTPQGKALYSKIEDVVSASNALYAAVAEINEQTPQQIKIGAFSSISRTILPGVLSKFKQMYPNIAVDVIVGGRDLDRRLLNGEVQLAFMDAYGAQGFDWIPLFSSPLVAVFPKDDDRDTDKPVDIHELFGETFISSPEQYVELIFPEVTSHKRLMIDASDDATIISMVASGLGVSVLSELSLRGYEQSVKTALLKTPVGCELGIATRSVKSLTPAAKSFVSFAKKLKY